MSEDTLEQTSEAVRVGLVKGALSAVITGGLPVHSREDILRQPHSHSCQQITL